MRAVKAYAQVMLKSVPQHPPWKRRCSRLCCNMPDHARSLSLGAGSLMRPPHVPTALNSLRCGFWVRGSMRPAISNIISMDRSISLKRIRLSLYCKSLLFRTHMHTKTCCSPSLRQSDLCVEAGTLQLRITIWWGQRQLLDTYRKRSYTAPFAPNRAFHFRGPHADESSKPLLQTSLCFVFPLCQL